MRMQLYALDKLICLCRGNINGAGGEKDGVNCTSNDIGICFSRYFSAIGLLSTNINNSEFEVPQRMLHETKMQSYGNFSLRALK